jgi:hypothetical protein
MIVNYELRKIYEEMVIIYLKMIYLILHREAAESRK